MRFQIKHENKGRMRIQLQQKVMTYDQANCLQYYLEQLDLVTAAKVHERVCTAIISYVGDREKLLAYVKRFRYEEVAVPESHQEIVSRQINQEYKEKLVKTVMMRVANILLLPVPVRNVITVMKSVKYLWEGIKTLARARIEVPVLDATAIGVSIVRGDYGTASSVMFLLTVGEILEEWTHKKSVNDLAKSMALNVSDVWLLKEETEVLVPVSTIETGDTIVVHMGNVIPFDGVVIAGEGMVNQASLTGESLPVVKNEESSVYAGTVLEEGELTILVKQSGGSSKYEKIVQMIEESEKLKSSLENKAENLADRLVPYSFLGTGLAWLFTRNAMKAISVLMVDYSCALKLAMPVSVLSAMREAGEHKITVKGGKYLEAIAEADTIVFDKTGTLTKACPTVEKVYSFNDQSPDELLRIAACLEEHFPHSMAKAVVNAASAKHLEHEEMHTKVDYLVAHGISSTIQDKKVIIGSYHFVFEDEKTVIRQEKQSLFAEIPEGYSYLYMAIDHELAAVICIVDPLREEAREVLKLLKAEGIQNVVMMTGDSEKTAAVIAKQVGVDSYFAEVLPEDKAGFVEKEKALGHKVIMVGDGINDSPALSAADVGIAISDGAELAREIADITVAADNLYQLVILKRLSNLLMKRIRGNYRFIVGFNSGLIIGGVMGMISPSTSALLHNITTLGIGVKSLGNLIE